MKVIRITPFLAMLSVALTAACGDSGSSGPDLGRAQAFVGDDPGSPMLSKTSPAFAGSASTATAFSGSISGDVQIAISADGTTWVDLGSPTPVTVQLQSSGDSTSVYGEVNAPTGTYSHVRLTVSGAEAHLAAGSAFGGITLNASVNVTLGGSDDQVVVETTVPAFRITANATTVITADLNTEAWLTEQSVTAQSVTDAAMQAAVRLAVMSQG